MKSIGNKPNAPTTLVFWVIWFAILNGLFIMLFFAAGGVPKGSNEGDGPVGTIGLAALLAVLSIGFRFLLIPRIKDPVKLLPVMILGLAMAEAIGIIGMFVVGREFPETRIALFVTSVSAVTVFAPVYIHSLSERQKMR
jgi:CDP-diglyceride synthetase